MTARSESIVRAWDASVMFSRRDSRDSMPSLASRISDWSKYRDRARRRRLSDKVDSGGRSDLAGEDDTWNGGRGASIGAGRDVVLAGLC